MAEWAITVDEDLPVVDIEWSEPDAVARIEEWSADSPGEAVRLYLLTDAEDGTLAVPVGDIVDGEPVLVKAALDEIAFPADVPEDVQDRTRGRVKALTALGAARSTNKERILAGQKPLIEGEPVSPATFKKVTGTSVAAIKQAAIAEAGSKTAAAKEARKQAAASRGAAGRAARAVKGRPEASVRPRSDASADIIAIVLEVPFWWDWLDAGQPDVFKHPHVTLAVVNAGDAETLAAVQQAVQVEVGSFCGQSVTIGDLGYFEREDGRIAYADALVTDAMVAARESLVSRMRADGLPVDDRFPDWVPHVTLAKLPTGAQYGGPVPNGHWTVHDIGVWRGDDRFCVYPARCDATPRKAPAVHTESRAHTFDIIRADAAELMAPEQLPNGWRRYPVLFSRAEIVQEYEESGKLIREYRPASEVFDPESMASGVGVPWELRHSADLLTPDTVLGVARGAVLDVQAHADGLHTCGPSIAWDRELFDAIGDNSARQVSVAYRCKIDRRPGTTDDGARFDQRQTKIRWNSLAAEPLGRAGTARVLTDRMDATDVVSRADALLAIARAGQTPAKPVYIDRRNWVSHRADRHTTHKDAQMNPLIKMLIQASGIAAPDLAAALGVSEADLEATLSGELDADMLAKFVAALGLGPKPAPKPPEAEAEMDAAMAMVMVDGTEYEVPKPVADRMAALEAAKTEAMDKADKATKRADAATKDMVSRADAETLADVRGKALAEAMTLAQRVHGYEFEPEARKDAAGAEQQVSVREWQYAAIRGAFGDRADAMIEQIERAPAAAQDALIEARMDDARTTLDAAAHKDKDVLASIARSRKVQAEQRVDADTRQDRLAAHKKQQQDIAAGKTVGATANQHGA